MFSMCSKAPPQTPCSVNGCGQLLWNRWSEEWVVLYDDSTMAWYTEPGRSSPAGKILVKESPEMLAISHWTGQIPKRPPLPDGCTVDQLIALGSRRKKSKVYWMLAQSKDEVLGWINAITKTLPPAPQIELVIDNPHLQGVLKRPLVRVRSATTKELSARSHRSYDSSYNSQIRGDAAVAILNRTHANEEANAKTSTLGCVLPWGHGFGWSILPNGVWSGGLTWSQTDDSFTLHALPPMHCTNMIETASSAMYYSDMNAFDVGADAGGDGGGGGGGGGGGFDDVCGEDFDYNVDCADFLI